MLPRRQAIIRAHGAIAREVPHQQRTFIPLADTTCYFRGDVGGVPVLGALSALVTSSISPALVALTPQEMKVRGKAWQAWTWRWTQRTDTSATADTGPESTEHGQEPAAKENKMVFVKTSEGWEVDQWTPGE